MKGTRMIFAPDREKLKMNRRIALQWALSSCLGSTALAIPHNPVTGSTQTEIAGIIY